MIFGENHKKEKQENLAFLGSYAAALRRNVGYPRRDEAGVPKWHPLGYATV